MNTELTKEEFLLLVMLYAASIDGRIQPEEWQSIRGKYDAETIQRMHRQFEKMKDAEILECIEHNKHHLLPTDADRQQFVADLHHLVDADDKNSPMEVYLLNLVEQLLS
jgi:hypothetical protein